MRRRIKLGVVLEAAVAAWALWKERASSWRRPSRRLPVRRFCCVHPGAILLSQPCHCVEPEGCLTSLAPACFCCLLCCASASPLDLPQPTRSKHSRTTSRQYGIPLSITRMDAIPHPHGCILAPRCLPRLAYLANSPFPPQRDSVNLTFPSPLYRSPCYTAPSIQCGIPNRHTTPDYL